MKFEFEPIGWVETCFKEKFGIPRQPRLAPSARGVIRLKNDPLLKTALKGLEGFSHLWVIFVFHRHDAKHWKPSVRPPRLGGAKKVGVLASRSPHRPNPIGISVVQLDGVDLEATQGPEVRISGVDLLDGTPVLDIKPYIAYGDSIPDARGGWAGQPIERNPVIFTPHAEGQMAAVHGRYPELRQLIQELVELDPRPAFQRRQMPREDEASQGASFGFKLYEFDVQWRIEGRKFVVTGLSASR